MSSENFAFAEADKFLGADPSKLLEAPTEKDKKKTAAAEAKDVKEQMKIVRDHEKIVTKILSKEDIEKSQSLIISLTRYGVSSRFGKYLSDNGFNLKATELKKLEITELEELSQRVKLCIANKSEDSLFTTGVLFGVNTVEAVTQRPGIKEKVDLSGWSSYLQNDEGFLDALEEIRINNSMLTAMSPEKRLAFSLASSAFTVHNVNKMAKQMSLAGLPVPPPPQKEPDVVEPEPSNVHVDIPVPAVIAVEEAKDKVIESADAPSDSEKPEPFVRKPKNPVGRKRKYNYEELGGSPAKKEVKES